MGKIWHRRINTITGIVTELTELECKFQFTLTNRTESEDVINKYKNQSTK